MPRLCVRRVLAATLVTFPLSGFILAADTGLPGPTVPDGFGVNIHFTDPGPGEMARFAEAGYRWVRNDFAWAAVERAPGRYRFEAYDRLLAHLKKVNARPLFILDYANPLYDEGHAPHTDAGRAAFARFAAAAASHYRGQGVLWEVWNEPNLAQFWKPEPNPVDYARLAILTATAVHSADPNAVVMAPASSEFPWSFLETTFRQGLLEHVDAVSVHPYRGHEPETAADDYGRLRALIARHAPAAKARIPIVSSEWGYSTFTGGVSETRQAQYLTRQWLANLSNGVNLSIFYDWRDDGDNPRENEHRFGTVRRNLDPKPSFLAARDLIVALHGTTYRHRLRGRKPTDWRLLFQKGSSDEIALVTWNAAPDAVEADALPRVRRLTSHDADFQDLRALASVRIGAGPLAESATHRASLDVTATSESVTISMGPTPPSKVTVDKGTTRRIELPASALRSDHRSVDIQIFHEHTPLPALEPLSVWRADPLTVHAFAGTGVPGSPRPSRAALLVRIENPAQTRFDGTVEIESGHEAEPRRPLNIPAGREHEDLQEVCPSERFRVLVRDSAGQTVASTGRMRVLPFPDFPTEPASASGCTRVDYVENVARPGTPVRIVNYQADGPLRSEGVALALDCNFGRGWHYTSLAPTRVMKIPPGARALTVWINPGPGLETDALRCRYRDTTGQTFQPDLGRVGPPGWRPLTIPLDGLAPGGHWGGADDNVPHPPCEWDSLLLIDSSGRKPHRGTVQIAAPFYVISSEG